MDTLIVALHVMSNLVWIGSIASVGWLTAAASRQEDPVVRKVVAELGYRLYKRAANFVRVHGALRIVTAG